TRYGVPASTILQANRLSPGATLTIGQQLVIPGYNGPEKSPATRTAQVEKPQPAEQSRVQRSASGKAHRVEAGETLYSIARRYDVHPSEIASANNVGMDYHVRIGETMSIPGSASKGVQ